MADPGWTVRRNCAATRPRSSRLLADAATRALPIWRGKPLFAGDDGDRRWAGCRSGTRCSTAAGEAPVFLGLDEDGARFAYDISGWEPEELPDTLGAFFDPSRADATPICPTITALPNCAA